MARDSNYIHKKKKKKPVQINPHNKKSLPPPLKTEYILYLANYSAHNLRRGNF